MGVPEWTELDERLARMREAGLYFDWPNPYNLEPGLYIIAHMEYTTLAGEITAVIEDAYKTVTDRLESGQFRNPRYPIPGRKTLFIRYELINQDDGTANPFPTDVGLFEKVREYLNLMFDQLQEGREFDLPYKLGPVRVFWCDMVEPVSEPTVTVEVFEETDSDSQEEAQHQAELPETAQQ